MKIRLALQSPDRRWRVEVVQRGNDIRYQLLEHGEVVNPFMTIGQIERHFAGHGIGMDQLVDVTSQTPAPTR